MSDHWQAFLRQDGDDQLLILTDIGIFEDIARLAPPRLLRIDLPVRGAEGYPDEAEDARLNVIEDDVVPRIRAGGGLYAGRITRTGVRSLFSYVSLDDAAAEALVAALGARFGIEPGSFIGDDPHHLVYRSLLYPTVEEWSAIHDVGVFDQLGENGDEREEPREVTHWAYFPSRPAADVFAGEVEAAGYAVAGIDLAGAGGYQGSHCVRFVRTDTPAFGVFTEDNARLRRLADRHGGTYDGWETMVVRKLQ